MKNLVEDLYSKKPYLDLNLLTSELDYSRSFKIENQTFTLLHLAAIRNPRILNKILSFKPDLESYIEIPFTNSITHHTKITTPLMYAIIQGHKENARLLIRAGANLNARCPISLNTPLALALYSQHWDLALELINLGAVCEIQEKEGNLSVLEKVTQQNLAPLELREKVFALFSFPLLEALYPQGSFKKFTWRVLPTELLSRLQEGTSLDTALNLKAKRIRKIIFNKVFSSEHLHFAQLSFYDILSSLGVTYDHLCDLIERIDFPLAYSWSSYQVRGFQQSFKGISAHFEERVVVRFILNTYQGKDVDFDLVESLWEDLCGMMLTIERSHRELSRYLPKKLRNLKQLHDHLASALARESQRDFPLSQEDLVSKLDGTNFKNFLITVPKTNHELINIGIEMNICVGSGLYGEKINELSSQIFTLKNSNDIFCVEIEMVTKEILQAKGPFNESMPSELVEELQSFLNHRLWWRGREGA